MRATQRRCYHHQQSHPPPTLQAPRREKQLQQQPSSLPSPFSYYRNRHCHEWDEEDYLFALTNLFGGTVDPDFLTSMWVSTLNALLDDEKKVDLKGSGPGSILSSSSSSSSWNNVIIIPEIDNSTSSIVVTQKESERSLIAIEKALDLLLKSNTSEDIEVNISACSADSVKQCTNMNLLNDLVAKLNSWENGGTHIFLSSKLKRRVSRFSEQLKLTISSSKALSDAMKEESVSVGQCSSSNNNSTSSSTITSGLSGTQSTAAVPPAAATSTIASNSSNKSVDSDVNSSSSDSYCSNSSTTNVFERTFYTVCNTISEDSTGIGVASNSSAEKGSKKADSVGSTEDAVLSLTLDLLNLDPKSVHRTTVLNTLKRSNFDVEETVYLMEKCLFLHSSSGKEGTSSSYISYASVFKSTGSGASLNRFSAGIASTERKESTIPTASSSSSSVVNLDKLSVVVTDSFSKLEEASDKSQSTSPSSSKIYPSFVDVDAVAERNLGKLSDFYRKMHDNSLLRMQSCFREAAAAACSKKTSYLATRCAGKGREHQFDMILNGNKAAVCNLLHLNRARYPRLVIDLESSGNFVLENLFSDNDSCNLVELDLHFLFVREAVEFVDCLLLYLQELKSSGSNSRSKVSPKAGSAAAAAAVTTTARGKRNCVSVILIVGAGNHSARGESRLKPAITRHLQQHFITVVQKTEAVLAFEL